MTLTLDPATEQRLQQELATGPYREPSALIAHLLDLIKAERDEESALRAALAEKLQRGYDQATRGELYSPEEARAILAARRILSPWRSPSTPPPSSASSRSWRPAPTASPLS